jgi:hypothetical protein
MQGWRVGRGVLRNHAICPSIPTGAAFCTAGITLSLSKSQCGLISAQHAPSWIATQSAVASGPGPDRASDSSAPQPPGVWTGRARVLRTVQSQSFEAGNAGLFLCARHGIGLEVGVLGQTGFSELGEAQSVGRPGRNEGKAERSSPSSVLCGLSAVVGRCSSDRSECCAENDTWLLAGTLLHHHGRAIDFVGL